MNTAPKSLICVVGPTAIGKTTMAIQLAKAFRTEILSADSRQFYKEMRIGTAVPSEAELQAVPHHFIGSLSIFDDYNVGDFERDAIAKLATLFKLHDTVVLAGGSGLYVDAVVNGLDDFPEVQSEVRDRLQLELEAHGIGFLQSELQKVDPKSFSEIDIQNKQRLIRALEIFRSAGLKYSELRKGKVAKRDFQPIYIGLNAPREIVYERINRRVDLMMENGLLAEAERLYPHRTLNALQTVGYKELFDWKDGKLSLEEAVSEIKKNSRRFAKRQGTWFRRNSDIEWFDYNVDVSEIVSYIKTKKGP